MNKVGFIFDSTAIIPHDKFVKYGFETVSLYLDIDGNSQLSTSIDEAKFFGRLSNLSFTKKFFTFPQTFVDAYEKQFAKGFKKIIVLPLSSKLSATHDVAIIARGMLDKEKQENVIVLDTLVCSLGFDSLMHSLYANLDQDLEAEELAKLIMAHAENTNILFEINDLKHLHRGGRLKKSRLLSVKFSRLSPSSSLAKVP